MGWRSPSLPESHFLSHQYRYLCFLLRSLENFRLTCSFIILVNVIIKIPDKQKLWLYISQLETLKQQNNVRFSFEKGKYSLYFTSYFYLRYVCTWWLIGRCASVRKVSLGPGMLIKKVLCYAAKCGK